MNTFGIGMNSLTVTVVLALCGDATYGNAISNLPPRDMGENTRLDFYKKFNNTTERMLNTNWAQLGPDIDGNPAIDGGFGWTTALSEDGTKIAVGGRGNYRRSNVRVLSWNTNHWNQMGSDLDVGSAIDSKAGYAVAISNNGLIVAVGSPYNDDNDENAGRAIVFEWNTTHWNQMGDIIYGKDAGSNGDFGWDIALSASGAILAVSARRRNYVRVLAYNGTSWNQVGEDIYGKGDFGVAIDLSWDGLVVAVGARNNEGNGEYAGQAQVHSFDGTTWHQKGSDIDGESAGDYFGSSIGLSADGNSVIVGAVYNSASGLYAGHARVYRFYCLDWEQMGNDIDAVSAGDIAGYDVAMSADGQIVALASPKAGGNGGAGHTRLFNFNETHWNQLGETIVGESDWDNFGRSVSLSADASRVAIGAPNNDRVFTDGTTATIHEVGHVRVFEWEGTPWPTRSPSSSPTKCPSMQPSSQPTSNPSISESPSSLPSPTPSLSPSLDPSFSNMPSGVPSESPSTSMSPSHQPSLSTNPTSSPSEDVLDPTSSPTQDVFTPNPLYSPTNDPLNTPTSDPLTPTPDPLTPTPDPLSPTNDPLYIPTSDPLSPTPDPLFSPTPDPLYKMSWDIAYIDLVADFGANSVAELIVHYSIPAGRVYETELLAQDCISPISDPNLAQDLPASLSYMDDTHDVLNLQYDVDKALIASSNIWNSSTNQIQLCQIVRLILPALGSDPKMIITEDVRTLSIDFDLSVDFQFDNNLGEGAIGQGAGQTSVDSYVKACKCDGVQDFTCDDSSPLLPNSELIICIKSVSYDVEVEFLDSLVVTQGSTSMNIIMANEVQNPSIASREYVPGMNGVAVSTRVPANLFTFGTGSTITVTGGVEMKLITSDLFARNLVSRTAKEFEQKATFDLKVNLQRVTLADKVTPTNSDAYNVASTSFFILGLGVTYTFAHVLLG